MLSLQLLYIKTISTDDADKDNPPIAMKATGQSKTLETQVILWQGFIDSHFHNWAYCWLAIHGLSRPRPLAHPLTFSLLRRLHLISTLCAAVFVVSPHSDACHHVKGFVMCMHVWRYHTIITNKTIKDEPVQSVAHSASFADQPSDHFFAGGEEVQCTIVASTESRLMF